MRPPSRHTRFNYALGLLVSAGMLSWPNGRPSYVALETIGGLDVPWWIWPLLLSVTALWLLLACRPRQITAAFIVTGVLIFTIAAGVALSIGPTVQLGASVIVVFGCIRQGRNAKSEAL